jgi:hypothetical protein
VQLPLSVLVSRDAYLAGQVASYQEREARFVVPR